MPIDGNQDGSFALGGDIDGSDDLGRSFEVRAGAQFGDSYFRSASIILSSGLCCRMTARPSRVTSRPVDACFAYTVEQFFHCDTSIKYAGNPLVTNDHQRFEPFISKLVE